MTEFRPKMPEIQGTVDGFDDKSLRKDVITFLKAEYTRTFQCSECGIEEVCTPGIVPDCKDGFVVIYGSGVDFCTHCNKIRENFEETTDSPADYDESEGEEHDNNVQAEAESEQNLRSQGLQGDGYR